MTNDIRKFIDIISEIYTDPMLTLIDGVGGEDLKFAKELSRFYDKYADITDNYQRYSYNVFQDDHIDELRDLSEAYYEEALRRYDKSSHTFKLIKMLYEYYHGDILNQY